MPNDVSATGHYRAYLRKPVKQQPGLDTPVIFENGGPRAFYVNIDGGCHNHCDCSGWGAFAFNRLNTIFTLGTGVLLDKLFGGAERGSSLGSLGGSDWGSRFGSYNVGNFNINMCTTGSYTYEAPPKPADKSKDKVDEKDKKEGTDPAKKDDPDNKGTDPAKKDDPANKGKDLADPVTPTPDPDGDKDIEIKGDNLTKALKSGKATAHNTTKDTKDITGDISGVIEGEGTDYPKSFTVTDISSGSANTYIYVFDKLENGKPVYKLDTKKSQITNPDADIANKRYTITQIKQSGSSYEISMETINNATAHI